MDVDHRNTHITCSNVYPGIWLQSHDLEVSQDYTLTLLGCCGVGNSSIDIRPFTRKEVAIAEDGMAGVFRIGG